MHHLHSLSQFHSRKSDFDDNLHWNTSNLYNFLIESINNQEILTRGEL